MSVALAEPAPIGHNLGPEPEPFDAIKVHCDDLYAEGKNWLDGGAITSDAEADKVTLLLDMAREATKTADDARVEENKPYDAGKAAVQAKYAPLISDTKAVKGTMVRLKEACLAALDPWRKKKAAEAAAKAEVERKAAEEAAAAAAKAIRDAAGDLGATEAAEELVKAAAGAQRDANRAERAATTGTGLRTLYVATMTDERAAYRYYVNDQPGEFLALAQRLADIDVRNGKRSLPGFDVVPTKVAV